jgi:CRP-like cAMP-binding protein
VLSSTPCLIMSEEIIIRQGDEGEFFYFISRGKCSVIIKNYVVNDKIGSKSQTVATLEEGSYFGEISLINNCDITATVVTSGHTTVAAIPKQKFLELSPKFLALLNE